MSNPSSKGLAGVVVAIVTIAVWAFVEWRSKAPPPPPIPPMPWEQPAGK